MTATGEHRDPRPARVEAPAGAPPTDLSLIALWHVARRDWKRIVLFPLAGLLLGVAVALLQPTRYVATSYFLPQETTDPRSSDIREMIGLDAVDRGASPAFYAELLTMRSILEAAASTEYEIVADGQERSGTLAELYEIEVDSEAAARRAAVGQLRDAVEVEIDGATGIVELAVTAPSLSLAEQLNHRLLELLNEFNQEQRQSRANAERQFLAEQVQNARNELIQAEDRLKRFLQDNRRFRESPELSFEYDRLQREVAFRQGLLQRLAEAFEQARIEEIRNTPTITVIDEPIGAGRRVGRAPFLMGLFGLTLGAMVAAFVVAGRALRHEDWV